MKHNFPTIDLPMPPSANHLWRSGKKRVYRSPLYKKWRNDAAWLIKADGFDNHDIPEPVAVVIAVSAKTTGDVDNRIKPVLDLLVFSSVIADDSKPHVQEVRAYWSRALDSGIRVSLMPAGEE